MIAPVLLAVAMAPMLIAFWVVAWLVGDLFAHPGPLPVPVRPRDGWGR
jgi:hypothetical protein